MSDSCLESLFRACRRDVERFFERRVGSREAAADLAQEAFLRLLRAQPAVGLRDPRAYLFRTANNLVIDYYRSTRAGGAGAIPDDHMAQAPADPRPSPEAVILSREALDVLRRAIAALPPRGREVFLLHKFEGLSYADIAVRLGISKNTVVVHMVRSLAHCKKHLDDYRRNSAAGG